MSVAMEMNSVTFDHDQRPINFAEAVRLAAERCMHSEPQPSKIPVQTAIASMERNCTKSSSVKSSTSSMSTDSSNESVTTTTSKPVIKLTPPLGGHQQRSSGFGARSNFEPNFLRQGRITRNPRNRRSMSDPNIQKTFLEVKKLWDEKARTSAKKRGGGSNDIINRRAIGIKPVLTTPTTTANSASISTTTSKRQPINPPPKIPPTATTTSITSSHKPSSNAWNVSKTPTRRFDYDKSIDQVDREVKELEIETTRERSSVFAKAMLFGPTGRPRSPFLREKPRAESSPPAPPSTTTTTTTANGAKEHPQTPPPVDRKPAKKQLPANANSFLAASLANATAKSAAVANNSDVTEVDVDDAAPTNDKENRSSALEVITANKQSVVTSGNEGDNHTSSDVTIPVANEEEIFVANEDDNVVALQRNASLARERRKSGGKQQQQQLNSSESSENETNKTIMDNNNKNTADKSMTAPLRSFLHRPGSGQRRNIASSDGNNSTRSTSTVSSAASSTYGQPDIGPLEILSGGGGQKCENRLSGAEEMIERRLGRFKRDDDSPVRARPNVLEIKSSGERSRAHTMDLGADEMVPRAQRSSSIASPRSNVSTPLSGSMRPDSMSSNMSTTSGEFNLASEYDKIAQQLAEEEDVVDQVADNEEDTVDDDDDTLKRTSKKRAVESQGDRKSVEVPSKQRAEDWTATAAAEGVVVEEDSRPPSPPLDVAVVPPTPVPPPPPEPVSLEKKLFNIAKELLSTEETYVDVLYLIDQVFHKTVVDAVAQKSIMPDAVVTGIFGHVSPIYNFHSQHLLQKLRDRIGNWDTKPMIGDIMVVAAPFMKMYSLYVQQFNEAMELIKTWQQKSSAFAAIMANIHRRPECGGLTLQGHMLTPVQRIPRYELLLIDYLSRLPTDSPDYEQTTKAVALIKTAAKHSNQTIQKLEKFHKLVQIFNQLSDVNFDIVDVSRELYKEGKIIKISARSGEKHDRYLYLFSDMLLCCAQLRGITVKNYRVTAKLDLEGMHVSREVHSSSNPNSNAYNCTFCVRGLQKTMEFQASNDEEKEKWITALNSAIEEHNERKSTFLHRGSLHRDGDTSPSTHLPPHSPTIIESPGFSLSRTAALTADLVSDAELGIRAPRWIKDHEVTMCMCCSKSFTFRRRRHHCRACGRVICSECSEHKFVLQYEQSKSQRVCTNCYKVLTGRERQEEADKKGVLEVEADEVTEHSVIADYLYFSEGEKKKNWTRMWCVIPNEQLCIYFYAAPQDVRAQLTLPLPGFAVNKLNSHDHKFAFKVSQGGKTMRFGAKDKMQMERWIYAISHASKGEDLTRAIVHNLGKPASSLPPAKHPDAVAVLPMITPTTSGVGHPRVVSSSSEEEFFPNGQSTAP